MSAIPPFLIGKNVTTYTLTPCTIADDGTITAGSASSLLGLWESVSVEVMTETEEISSADSSIQNHVIIKNGWRVRCTTLLKRAGVNPLAALIGANDYFLLTLARGGQTWTGYVLRESYTEELQKGKSTATASFLPCGFQPTYS